MAYKKTLFAFLLCVGFLCGASSSQAATIPTITEPESREVVDFDNSPQLKWNRVQGATKYDVQIRCSDCGYTLDTPGLRKTKITGGWRFTVTKNEMSLPEDLKDNLYRFRVRARYSDGTYSAYSSYRFFKVEDQYNEEDENFGDEDTEYDFDGRDVTIEPDQTVISTNETVNFMASWKDPQQLGTIEILVNARLVTTCKISKSYHACAYTGGPYKEGSVTYGANFYPEESSQRIWTGYKGVKVIKNSERSAKTTITSPDNNTTFYRVPNGITVEWKKVSGATRYQVELACKTCSGVSKFWLYPDYYYSNKNSFTLKPATHINGPNDYRVRIRPIFGSDDSYGTWSESRYFYFDPSRTYTLPTLNIRSSDSNISSQDGEMVTLSVETNNGTALDKIEIYMNGVRQNTCYDVSTCSERSNVRGHVAYGNPVSYYAIGYIDLTNEKIYSPTKYITVEDRYVLPTLNIRSSDSNISSSDNATVRLTAETNNGTALDKIEIYVNGTRQYTCYDVATCSDTANTLLYENQGSVSYYAIGYIDVTGQRIYSSTQTITIADRNSRLTKPVINSPSSDESFSGYPTNIFLGWSNVAEAQHYKVVIECFGCNGTSSWVVSSTQFPTTNFYSFTPGRGAYDYRFRVLPVYSDGGGVWSEYRYFGYNY